MIRPRGIIVRCQPEVWMISELMKDYLLMIWNRRPGALLRKWGMLALVVLMGHLTPEMKATITGSYMNTGMVIPGRGDYFTAAGARCYD